MITKTFSTKDAEIQFAQMAGKYKSIDYEGFIKLLHKVS